MCAVGLRAMGSGLLFFFWTGLKLRFNRARPGSHPARPPFCDGCNKLFLCQLPGPGQPTNRSRSRSH